MKNIRNFLKKHLITISFIVGFAQDSFLLPSPDNDFSWIIGITYISIIAIFITIREYINIKHNHLEKYLVYTSNIINFFSGSLLSFVFIYYFRSSSFLISLPMLIMISLVILANEIIKDKKYRRLVDMTVLFISSIFYFIFAVPIFVGSISDKVFVFSVFFGVLLYALYLSIFLYFCKKRVSYIRFELLSFALVLFLIVLLYITKTLPAVPLSLKSAGIYTNMYKSGNVYFAEKEKKYLYDRVFNPFVYHYSEEDTVYFFSSIHAPTKINTNITHVWEYYDEKTSKWVQDSKYTFPIIGGRDGGYRAYTINTDLEAGDWRVTVITEDNRTIGRYSFKIINNTTGIEKEEVQL